MMTDCFDDAVILNMSLALERVCRDIPVDLCKVDLRKHEDRCLVAARILASAHDGKTRLDDFIAVGRSAVDELFPSSDRAA